jgi:hypothetical protein
MFEGNDIAVFAGAMVTVLEPHKQGFIKVLS